jgi:hypothetical protein
MVRMTAHERDAAFQCLNNGAAAMAEYHKATSAKDRSFERDVIRESVEAAKALRLANVDYPSIP